MVLDEGDEAYMTNLCQKCFNKHLQAKGEKPLTNVQWREVVEKKAYRGRMWKMMGREPYLRGMWEYFLQERSRVKRFRELADEEKQAGVQGQWQQESPSKEYLEQMKCCHDTDCNEPMMKKGFFALKSGEWEEFQETFRKKMKASAWAFDRIKEAFELVAQDEAEKMSIVQEIMLRSTDCLRCINLPVGGQGRVIMPYLCPHCNSFPLEDYVWWVSGENPPSGGAQFVEKSTIGSNRTGFWSCKQVIVLGRPRSSKRMQYLKACAPI